MWIQVGYAAIVLAGASIVAIALIAGEVNSKDIATGVLALFGTFLGATLAFRLTENKERQRVAFDQRRSLNRAMFVLARQYNALHQLKTDYERYPTLFEKAFNLPALKPPSYSDLIQNFTELEFMLEANPDLLFRLTVEQECFHQAIDSVRIRNEFYVGEVQPELARLSLNGKLVNVGEVAKALGERIFGGAMNGADIAFQHISKSNDSVINIQAELRQFARGYFPGHKFVSYEAASQETPAK